MNSRAILGLASVAGFVFSVAVPALAQTTPPSTTPPTTPSTTPTAPTTPTTTTSPQPATPDTSQPMTTPPLRKCPPGTSTTGATSTTKAPNTTTTTNGTTTTNATTTTNGTTTCTNTSMPPAGVTTPESAPTTPQDNYNALSNNPNGSNWLAKFNRPNVIQQNRNSNYLGTTTRPWMHRTHMMRGTKRCRYVMEHGVRTKVCP